MFQFRRFPTYAYLIQRTLHGYCPCGLPHSEIRGSRDICSSPRLIAACHVLRRLLMPRHSPCALFSLTCSSQSPLDSVSGFAENCVRSLTPRFRLRPASLGSEPVLRTGDALSLHEFVREMVLSRIMQASQRSSRNCNCYPAPFRTLFHNYFCHTLVWRLSVALLITCVALFSFQGALSSSFEARSKHLIPIKCFDLISMVEIVGFEPATSCLQGRRSPS